MKINELIRPEDEYSQKNIAKKQKAMAKKLQLKWANDKKALAAQGKPTSVVDYLKRAFPVFANDDHFGNTLPADPTWRQENKFIAQSLDDALKQTSYWKRQIEKRAGMTPTAFQEPQQQQPIQAQEPQQQQPTQAAQGQPGQASWANQRQAAWNKNHSTAWASKRNANWKAGQVTQRAPQQQTQQKPAQPAAPTTSTEIPNGTIVPYNNTQYKWANNAWRDVNTGEVLTGKDAEAATYNYRNPE